jgi:hypothetical protein
VLKPFFAQSRRRRHPLGPDFEVTESNPDAVPDKDAPWRDSSIELEHGLQVEEVPADSLPDYLRDSLLGNPK